MHLTSLQCFYIMGRRCTRDAGRWWLQFSRASVQVCAAHHAPRSSSSCELPFTSIVLGCASVFIDRKQRVHTANERILMVRVCLCKPLKMYILIFFSPLRALISTQFIICSLFARIHLHRGLYTYFVWRVARAQWLCGKWLERSSRAAVFERNMMRNLHPQLVINRIHDAPPRLERAGVHRFAWMVCSCGSIKMVSLCLIGDGFDTSNGVSAEMVIYEIWRAQRDASIQLRSATFCVYTYTSILWIFRLDAPVTRCWNERQ